MTDNKPWWEDLVPQELWSEIVGSGQLCDLFYTCFHKGLDREGALILAVKALLTQNQQLMSLLSAAELRRPVHMHMPDGTVLVNKKLEETEK